MSKSIIILKFETDYELPIICGESTDNTYEVSKI